MDRLTFDHVLRAHAFCSVAVGVVLTLMPHALFGRLTGEPSAAAASGTLRLSHGWSPAAARYSYVAHEVARCYGGLTLAQAWFE